MRLADHGVAADAAQLVGDLAGGRALGPHRLQALDPLFSPGHAILLRILWCPPSACCAMPQPIGGRTVNDQLAKPQPELWTQQPPGEPVLSGVNWVGLKTLYIKEVRRFFKVQMQTVWAPGITTLLYLAIFTVALGARRPHGDGRALRRLPRARPDRHGDDPERLRQRQLLAAGRQDPGHDRRLSDAAAVDRRADGRAGRRGGDARLLRRLRGVAGDAVLAGRVGRDRASAGGLVVRADGRR